MSEPYTRTVETPAGPFRVLHWDGVGVSPVLFLHGLTGLAEVWGPTVQALGDGRPGLYAMDQRGHGDSPQPPSGYDIGRFVRDVHDVAGALDLPPFHLVGHSMGARVALVFAARYPALLQSVTIVDIGPEAWRQNWESTVAAFDRLPATFPTIEDATRAGRARGGESADAALSASGLGEIARARWRQRPDGQWQWRASRDALKQAVRSQRSRNYWREWRAIDTPALLIRGGTSTELRPPVAVRMRRENPRIGFVQFEGIGHNIPLIAPTMLADALRTFWQSV